MKASEARKLMNENLHGPEIELALTFIHKKIAEAAKQGNNSLTYPLSGCSPWPSPEAQQAVSAQLRKDGFKVTDHLYPDPNHEGASDYDQVSW